ncbi:MAG: uracil-DNA glycosylase [Treponema sp.]|nr:uracil-DNA glycosylase [Treponema sp.]
MTAGEKTNLARFLDLAAGVARGGYAEKRDEYDFHDDIYGTTEEAIALNGAPMEAPAFSGTSASSGPVGHDDSFEQIEAGVRSCEACRLAQTRKNAVPGEGARKPVVMVIGEGPGAEEDESGRPFVGKAGQLLDKMLAAIDLSRQKNCFIANVIKCRPPNNRDPNPDETTACAAFLERQVRLLEPAFILCAGRIAAQTLLDTHEGIGKLRGKITKLDIAGRSIPFLATYHPSALLRNEELKRPAWEDLKLLRSALDDPTALEPGTG